MLLVLLPFLAVVIFELYCIVKVYMKANKPGWAIIIPFYNTWVLAEIGGKPGWWGLWPLLYIIPVIGWILGLVVALVVALGVAQNFGRSAVFGFFGLFLFSFVGFPILALDSSTYRKNGNTTTEAPSVPPVNPPLA